MFQFLTILTILTIILLENTLATYVHLYIYYDFFINRIFQKTFHFIRIGFVFKGIYRFFEARFHPFSFLLYARVFFRLSLHLSQ